MPNYDYQCEKCGHQFEVFQSMNDAKLTDCPEEGCEGPVRRLLGTGAGLIFKGGGFYQTDYRSDSYKAGAKKESEGSKPKKESKSSDSKPSSKPSSKPKASDSK
jgi:putative FmdB family regulatory protein